MERFCATSVSSTYSMGRSVPGWRGKLLTERRRALADRSAGTQPTIRLPPLLEVLTTFSSSTPRDIAQDRLSSKVQARGLL